MAFSDIPCNPVPLLRRTMRHGVYWKRIPRLLLYIIRSLLYFPFFCLEALLYRRTISHTQFIQPPVFILGQHRSGTTLLFKLLAADPSCCYFRNSDILFPKMHFPGRRILKKMLAWLLRKTRVTSFAYNNVLFNLDDPQEEDMCFAGMMLNQHFYWSYVFPNAVEPVLAEVRSTTGRWKSGYVYHLKRLQSFHKQRRLVLKNPPNMMRVKALLELFPDARFIYIERDPASVLYSAQRLWTKGLRMFSLQRYTEPQVLDTLFTVYHSFRNSYQNEKHLVPAANLVEVSYSDLESDPVQLIRKIYTSFNWNWEQAAGPVTQLAESEKAYRKFRYTRNARLESRLWNELPAKQP